MLKFLMTSVIVEYQYFNTNKNSYLASLMNRRQLKGPLR